MELKLHLVAPEEYKNLKEALEKKTTYNGQPLNISIANWDYSLNSLGYWAVENQENEQPDVILVFDSASYKRIDSKTDETLLYQDFIDNLKKVQLSVQSKIVLVLSKEKEENLELLNEIIKLNIQNFFFAEGTFSIQDILTWIFTEKKLKDNEQYLVTGKGDKKTKVLRQIEKQTEIKEIEKVIEKKIIETRTEYIETKKIIGYSRKIFCIPENTDFACEIAYTTAKAMPELKVGLINLHAYSYIDVAFNLSLEGQPIDGLTQVMEEIESGKIPFEEDWKSSRPNKKLPDNLYIITNNYGKGSGYTEEKLEKLISHAHNYFDALYILTPMLDTSDEYKVSVRMANIVFATVNAGIPAIRDVNRIMTNMPPEKLWYVAWAYNQETDLPIRLLKQSMLNEQYAGLITYTSERKKAVNTEDVSYAESAYKKHYREYSKILKRFRVLLPKPKKNKFNLLNNKKRRKNK